MMALLKNYSLDDLGRNFSCLFLGSPGFNRRFPFAPVFQWCFLTTQGSPNVSTRSFYVDLIFLHYMTLIWPAVVQLLVLIYSGIQ